MSCKVNTHGEHELGWRLQSCSVNDSLQCGIKILQYFIFVLQIYVITLQPSFSR